MMIMTILTMHDDHPSNFTLLTCTAHLDSELDACAMHELFFMHARTRFPIITLAYLLAMFSRLKIKVICFKARLTCLCVSRKFEKNVLITKLKWSASAQDK